MLALSKQKGRVLNEQSSPWRNTRFPRAEWSSWAHNWVSVYFNLFGCSLKSEQARCLRKHFVFKIIPMLNPDGVSRGYYRFDTKGYNLNRFYMNPSKTEHPTIWAAKKVIVQHAEVYKDLFMYIDFHAHASKKGGFMFGNYLTDQVKQTENITFTKLVAMNCLNFDMTECNFSDKIMSIKDKNGLSREGSSRVAL